MKEAQFTCIVCPKSCAVTVTDRDGELSISGYECKRGMDHARDEYLHPMRMLTATVKIVGGDFPRLGVIGTREVQMCIRDRLYAELREKVHKKIYPTMKPIFDDLVELTGQK